MFLDVSLFEKLIWKSIRPQNKTELEISDKEIVIVTFFIYGSMT